MISQKRTHAKFRYWNQADPAPFSEIFSVINGTHQNIKTCPAEVHDIRTSPTSFSHSTNGFQVVQHKMPTNYQDLNFLDNSTIAAEYWPGLITMVKTQLKARSVAILNNVVRQTSKESYSQADISRRLRGANTTEAPRASKPFHLVHNDYSTDGARNALRAILPTFFEEVGSAKSTSPSDQKLFFDLRHQVIDAEDEAVAQTDSGDYSNWNGTRYQGPRWAIFSVWQPLEVVKSDPLAMIDATSIWRTSSTFDEKSQAYAIFQTPHHDRRGFANHMGNTMMPLPPKPNQQHRWCWVSEQRPDEVTLIKLFDSEAWLEGSQVAPCSPHSAFQSFDQSESKPRLSIETRMFVIW